MGITIVKIIIWESLWWIYVWKSYFKAPLSHHSKTFILQYTSSNKNFESLNSKQSTTISIIMSAQCGPLPQAYGAYTKRPVLCIHLGFNKGIQTLSSLRLFVLSKGVGPY